MSHAPDDTIVVQTAAELGDGLVKFGQAVEGRVPQPAEQPALGDQHPDLDLGLIAGFVGPGRQHRGAIVRGHVGVGAVDHRVVEAGLDDGDLGVIRHEQRGHAADRGQGPVVRLDPVPERLRPGRLGIEEARRPEHGDEDLRAAALAG